MKIITDKILEKAIRQAIANLKFEDKTLDINIDEVKILVKKAIYMCN
ncbi:MAG: hypothetical protein RR404_02875 [Bacilli bacterium]